MAEGIESRHAQEVHVRQPHDEALRPPPRPSHRGVSPTLISTTSPQSDFQSLAAHRIRYGFDARQNDDFKCLLC